MPAARRAGVGAYIGPAGALIEVPIVAASTTTEERPSTEMLTLGGRRIVTVAPAVRRSWSVQIPGQRPHELGALAELLRATAGPYVWVSPYAQVTNVLTPAAASFATAPAGTVTKPGFDTLGAGFAPSAVALSSSSSPAVIASAPVVPGYPVTAAVTMASVASGTSMTLRFVSAAGATVGTDVVVKPTAQATPARVSASGVAPTGAAAARLVVSGTSVSLARPSITWTDGMREWAPGHGCDQAVAVTLPMDHRATFADTYAARTVATALEVREVG